MDELVAKAKTIYDHPKYDDDEIGRIGALLVVLIEAVCSLKEEPKHG